MGHYRYFVITEERNDAERELDSNNFVCSEGYFGGGKCDWYEVGGRFSGALVVGYEEFFAEQRKLPNEDTCIKCAKYSDCTQTANCYCRDQETLDRIWKKHTGATSINPISRKKEQEDEDCRLITPELREYMQKHYADEEVFDAIEYDEYLVQHLSESHDGKFITVIDYHM